METFDNDETQLSKVRIQISRCGDHFVSKTFSAVTPPPSPHIIERDVIVDGDVDGDDERPPHSYVRLVILALLECPGRQATIREIYARITRRFPYYRENRLHWKNSVRHNLTVFHCFERVAGEDVAKPSRGSFLWRLVGDFQSVLEKEDVASVKRSRYEAPSEMQIKRAHAMPRSDGTQKSKVGRPSKLERENAKRRKREKARKLKLKNLKASMRKVERLPLAEFNYCTTTTTKDQPPLPSRMPTPPPKLPGIDKVFLPSPTPSISPPKNSCSGLWGEAPELNLDSAHFSFDINDLNELTDLVSNLTSINDFPSPLEPAYTPPPIQTNEYDLAAGFQPELDFGIGLHQQQQHQQQQRHHNPWYQYTPEPSPARSTPDWSSDGCPSGYTPPSNSTTLWELVEPEVDGMMGLLTLNMDWMSTTSHDGGLIRL